MKVLCLQCASPTAAGDLYEGLTVVVGWIVDAAVARGGIDVASIVGGYARSELPDPAASIWVGDGRSGGAIGGASRRELRSSARQRVVGENPAVVGDGFVIGGSESDVDMPVIQQEGSTLALDCG